MVEPDIIVALSTSPQPASRSVLRVSGPGCQDIVLERVRVTSRAGRLVWGVLDSPFRGVPCQLALFETGHGYTGEEAVEIHLPGQPRLAARLTERLVAAGARRAERGEFTRRAVANGRLSLGQAAAVQDIIRATDEENRRRALAVLGGTRKDTLGVLVATIQEALVAIENDLDFDDSDDGLLDGSWYESRIRDIGGLWSRIRAGLGDEFVPTVALSGPVNTGKSTLFNALGGNVLATDRPGTTRDWNELDMEVEGLRFRLVDLPGTGGPGDDLDRAAADSAAAVRRSATLVIRLVRCDSDDDADWYTCADLDPSGGPEPSLSARTGVGIPEFRRWIAGQLSARREGSWLGAEDRLRIDQALADLQADHAALGADGVIWSNHLRELKRLLDPLGTRVHPDDVLNDLFAGFCIGK